VLVALPVWFQKRKDVARMTFFFPPNTKSRMFSLLFFKQWTWMEIFFFAFKFKKWQKSTYSAGLEYCRLFYETFIPLYGKEQRKYS